MTRKMLVMGLYVALAVFALAATVGWISNAYSKVLCQQTVAAWLFNEPIGGRSFYLIDAASDRDAGDVFDSIKATYSVLPAGPHAANTWPRLAMKTHTWIPFVVSVDYFWEREFLIGGGATKRFLCFFGTVVYLGETDEFAT